MTKQNSYLLLFVFVWLCAAGAVAQSVRPDRDAPLPSRSKSPIDAGTHEVVRVIDGDTIIVGDKDVRSKQHRVRFIGADTPETVAPGRKVEPFGLEATEFTKRKIAEAGNKVRIAFDGEEIDRYDRTLAMIYLKMPDGKEVWLNELLIREGLAHARLHYRL